MIATVTNALVELVVQTGAVSALKAARRRLDLGRLDPNHDIARSAWRAQLRASLFLLESAKAELLASASNKSTRNFDLARSHLLNRLAICERATTSMLAAAMPDGGYARANAALTTLFKAEKFETERTEIADNASKAALRELTIAGAWDDTPAPLRAKFSAPLTGFAAIFANFLAVEIKTNDPFFRIFIALRQEETLSSIEAMRIELAAYASERSAASKSFLQNAQSTEPFEREAAEFTLLAENLKAIKGDTEEIKEQNQTLMSLVRGKMFDAPMALLKLRHRRSLGAVVVGAAAIMASAIFVWWDKTERVTTEWCVNYAEYWGVPKCVGKIARGDLKGRYAVYRLKSKAGRVREMARVSSYGALRDSLTANYEEEPWSEGVAKWRYSESPNPMSVDLFNSAGRKLRTLTYKFDYAAKTGVVEFDRDLGKSEKQSGESSALCAVSSERSTAGRSTIGQHRLTFGKSGLLTTRSFELSDGNPVPDAFGRYGKRYGYDEPFGLVESIKILDAKGALDTDRCGVAEIRSQYDEAGLLKTVEWRDLRENLTPNELGFAAVLIERDTRGNLDNTKYTNNQGDLVHRSDWQIARIEFIHDKRGDNIVQRYFGLHGIAIVDKEFGAAAVAWQHNPDGHVISVEYLDASGERTLDTVYRVSRIEWKVDRDGNPLDERYFGADSERVERTDWNVARIVRSYNEDGDKKSETYFDLGDEETLDKIDGVARIEWDYEKGRLHEKRYFGLNGEPTRDRVYGAAKLTWDYDLRGNTQRVNYFLVNDAGEAIPTTDKDYGVFSIVWGYDDAGNETSESYRGIKDEETVRKDWNVALIRREYPDGLKRRESYFDLQGKPTSDEQWGVAAITWDYKQGIVAEERYFDVNDKPTLRKGWEVAGITWSYPDNERHERYIGLGNKATARATDKVACAVYVKDAEGEWIEDRICTEDAATEAPESMSSP